MSKFYVGQKVRITGDYNDYTDHLHGYVGTVVKVREDDCIVNVPAYETENEGWYCWNYNLTPVDVTDSEA